jgi:hypothetical protein
MQEQKKALKWKELENGDLFAVEAIKPKEGNLKFGLAFRIWFHNTDGENCQSKLKYWISIYYFDTASVRNFRTDSLEGAKALCDLYRKSYLDSLLESKVIADHSVSDDSDLIEWKAITIGSKFPSYRGEAVDIGFKLIFIVQQIGGAWKVKISCLAECNEYYEYYMAHPYRTLDDIKSWCEDWRRKLITKENES